MAANTTNGQQRRASYRGDAAHDCTCASDSFSRKVKGIVDKENLPGTSAAYLYKTAKIRQAGAG